MYLRRIFLTNRSLSFLNINSNPPDGKFKSVHFAESLLVREGGDVLAETLEGVIDALHPPPLPHVSRVSHLHLRPEYHHVSFNFYRGLALSVNKSQALCLKKLMN